MILFIEGEYPTSENRLIIAPKLLLLIFSERNFQLYEPYKNSCGLVTAAFSMGIELKHSSNIYMNQVNQNSTKLIKINIREIF